MGIGIVLVLLIGCASLLAHYSLNNIKSKTVGDGQHGTARFATKAEIAKTYRKVKFTPELWRKNPDSRPQEQGLVLGTETNAGELSVLVDTDDIHCLMIGASGVGKTA